jgi:O-6-methylguanine DNA methyltransferase
MRVTLQLTLPDLWPQTSTTERAEAMEAAAAGGEAATAVAEGAEAVAPAVGAPPGPYAVAALPSPAGEVLVAFSDTERTVVLLATAEDPDGFARRVAEHTGRPPVTASDTPEWLRTAVASASGAGVSFEGHGLSRFETAVLRQTAEIPPGEVRPYAWVAAAIGQPGAVRAVGRALGRNPVPLLIPCHRVVRTDGTLGGYALGPACKRALLAAEGVDLTWLAQLARGRVRFVGTSSGRYCYPTCANARETPLEQQAPFVTATAASTAGYQPCDRCRADLA